MARAFRENAIEINDEVYHIGDYVTFNTKSGEYCHNVEIVDIKIGIDGSAKIDVEDYYSEFEVNVADIID